MRTGLSLTELAARIEANRELKQDYIVPAKAMDMVIHEDRVPALRFDAVETAIRPIAHSQIGARLDIPKKYYDRMLTEKPELLAKNVNEWLHSSDDKRLVRTLGGDTRAFLSNRYNRIEHEEIAEVALPILADIPDVKVISSEVTERRMYIQAVAPRVQGEVKVGDVVQAGVIISNSEVGLGSVTVQPLLYRLVCLNGMVRNDTRFRAYHVGRQVSDNEALWADDTRQADDRAVLLKVRDAVRAAVDESLFAEAIAKLSDLTERRITGNPVEAVEMLAKKTGVSDGEKGGILRSLIEGGDLSAWGLVNAVTAQAHTTEDYDRSVEIEILGGQIVDLSPKDWREVLEAA